MNTEKKSVQEQDTEKQEKVNILSRNQPVYLSLWPNYFFSFFFSLFFWDEQPGVLYLFGIYSHEPLYSSKRVITHEKYKSCPWKAEEGSWGASRGQRSAPNSNYIFVQPRKSVRLLKEGTRQLLSNVFNYQ